MDLLGRKQDCDGTFDYMGMNLDPSQNTTVTRNDPSQDTSVTVPCYTSHDTSVTRDCTLTKHDLITYDSSERACRVSSFAS